jgi:hypothetical protein
VDVPAYDVSTVLVCQNIVVDKLAIVIINGKLSIANLIEKDPSGPVEC